LSSRPALTHIGFGYGSDSTAAQTLFSQHMLDEGFLAGSAFYPTLAHGPSEIDRYLDAANRTLARLADAVDHGRVRNDLRGPIAQVGFQRLT